MHYSLIDAGVNLANYQFDGQHQEVLNRAAAAGVTNMLIIGCDITTSIQSLELAIKYQQFSTAGVHPHDAKMATEQLESQLTELAKNQQVIAIGECGLDYNRDFSPRDIQRSVLRRQLALAETLNLPVYLHERDASDDMLSILKEFKVRGVLHCFTGNATALQQLVPSIPLNRLLIETDAPFLIPRTVTPKPKYRRNEPALLSYVCETIAQLYGVAPHTVAKYTKDNFYRVFALKADE
jgi:TatD DNase family protein